MSASIFFGVLFAGIVVGFVLGYLWGRDGCTGENNEN